MRRTLVLALLLLVVVLAGCGAPLAPTPAPQQAAPPTTAPQPTVSQPTAVLPTPVPQVTNASAPTAPAVTVEPSPSAAVTDAPPTPAASPTPAWPTVALTLQQAFARDIGLEVQEVTIAEAQPMRWPDDCLGLALPGEVCQQGEVAGYRVVLQVGAERYTYHADETGVVMRSSDAAGQEASLLVWTLEDANGCAMALVSAGRVEFGPCGGATLRGPLTEEQAKALNQWVHQFAPFEVQTPAGYLNLAGRGAAIATPPQQLEIAEWARRLGAGLVEPPAK